ncbi:MAG: TerB family tellurite resistance protein [Proteobacteria bacterium]|nr:TerB family tellurite resistance protein [Pseudomonadota bacterium]
MLKEIVAFVVELAGGETPPAFDAGDFRLSSAALLVHVATLDGELMPETRVKLHDLLKRRFDLEDTATEELIDAAVVADHDAIDFYHFTSQINRALDAQGRLRMIEMMWQTAFVDGKVSEFEDNVIWRVADLLNVSSAQRIDLRRRIAAERDGANVRQG